jgi:hypothetical protein
MGENIHHDLPVKLAVYKDIAQNGQSPETIDDPAVILNIIDALAALDICSSVGEMMTRRRRLIYSLHPTDSSMVSLFHVDACFSGINYMRCVTQPGWPL